MKVSTRIRILSDFRSGLSLKELYWSFLESTNRYKKMFTKENRSFVRVVLKSQKDFLFNSIKSISRENEKRATAAVDWLIRAKKSSQDHGVSLGYFPCNSTYDSGGIDIIKAILCNNNMWITNSLNIIKNKCPKPVDQY